MRLTANRKTDHSRQVIARSLLGWNRHRRCFWRSGHSARDADRFLTVTALRAGVAACQSSVRASPLTLRESAPVLLNGRGAALYSCESFLRREEFMRDESNASLRVFVRESAILRDTRAVALGVLITPLSALRALIIYTFLFRPKMCR